MVFPFLYNYNISMVFTELCPPALIYLVFSITQIVIDSVKGMYNTALVKIWVAFIFTILLNYLCQLGLGIISWFIVFIPFVLMTIIVGILLLMFGLDPATGKIKVNDPTKDHKHHKHGPELDDTHTHHPPNPPDKPISDSNKILDYYKSKGSSGMGGGGGGGGSVASSSDKDDFQKDSQKEKTNKILSRSLLFYSDTIEDKDKLIQKRNKKGGETGGSNYEQSDEYLDTTKYKDTVSVVTTTLNDMGEHDIAVWFENSALECVNAVNGMKRDNKAASINKCFNDLLSEVEVKISGNSSEKATLFRNNMNDTICHNNRIYGEIKMCGSSTEKSWWN